jgi:outer membrane lipoprotein carrier protein
MSSPIVFRPACFPREVNRILEQAGLDGSFHIRIAAMRILRRVSLGCLAALLAWRSVSAVPLGEVVRRMERFYRASPGIAANFVQVLETRTLPRPQEESGTVYLRPPGRMRWEYTQPPGKLAVTDGERAFLYLPEDRQVVTGRIRDLEDGAVAARLLLAETPLERSFRVQGDPLPGGTGVWALRLTPIDAEFPFEAITVEVEETTGIIRRILLLDPLGSRIEYRFSEVRLERELPDRLFTFRVPRGVDIQDLSSGTGPGSRVP